MTRRCQARKNSGFGLSCNLLQKSAIRQSKKPIFFRRSQASKSTTHPTAQKSSSKICGQRGVLNIVYKHLCLEEKQSSCFSSLSHKSDLNSSSSSTSIFKYRELRLQSKSSSKIGVLASASCCCLIKHPRKAGLLNTSKEQVFCRWCHEEGSRVFTRRVSRSTGVLYAQKKYLGSSCRTYPC